MPADPTARPNGEDREAIRHAAIAALPTWYSPWAHLAFPSLFGLALIAVMVAALSHLRAVELLTIPAVWLLSNAVEWRAHKDLLHRRFPFMEVLYERHTPQHHRIFIESDMAMRDTREFGLVLIPFYGILAIVSLDVPFALVLYHFGYGNGAALFIATSAAYVLSYEWLHLSYHLPEAHPIGRLALVARLRRHHATHHNPALMQRYNFNVTVPLWDLLRGTTYRGQGQEQAQVSRGSAALSLLGRSRRSALGRAQEEWSSLPPGPAKHDMQASPPTTTPRAMQIFSRRAEKK